MARITNRFYADYSVYYWSSPDGVCRERCSRWEVRDRLRDDEEFGPYAVCPDDISCRSLARALNDELAPYGIGQVRGHGKRVAR